MLRQLATSTVEIRSLPYKIFLKIQLYSRPKYDNQKSINKITKIFMSFR